MRAKATTREESLGERSVAELLADAYLTQATGTWIFESDHGALSAVRFVRGLVVQATGVWQTTSLERGALSAFLPDDALKLVREHAAKYRVGWFFSVEQLALLPPESLRAACEAMITRGTEQLSKLPLSTRQRFRPGQERLKAVPCLEPGLVPLNLVITAELADSRPLARSTLCRFRDQPLELVLEGRSELRDLLRGPSRAIFESLSRQSRSLVELERMSLVAPDSLYATVYALWITKKLVPEPRAGRQPQHPNDVRPTTTSRPPRDSKRASEPVESRRGASQERALEARVLEAWALAEADARRVEKASAFVSRAALVFPKNPRLRYFSACLHQRAGRVDDARAEFSKALELDPGYTDARRDLRRLEAEVSARESVRGRLFGKG